MEHIILMGAYSSESSPVLKAFSHLKTYAQENGILAGYELYYGEGLVEGGITDYHTGQAQKVIVVADTHITLQQVATLSAVYIPAGEFMEHTERFMQSVFIVDEGDCRAGEGTTVAESNSLLVDEASGGTISQRKPVTAINISIDCGTTAQGNPFDTADKLYELLGRTTNTWATYDFNMSLLYKGTKLTHHLCGKPHDDDTEVLERKGSLNIVVPGKEMVRRNYSGKNVYAATRREISSSSLSESFWDKAYDKSEHIAGFSTTMEYDVRYCDLYPPVGVTFYNKISRALENIFPLLLLSSLFITIIPILPNWILAYIANIGFSTDATLLAMGIFGVVMAVMSVLLSYTIAGRYALASAVMAVIISYSSGSYVSLLIGGIFAGYATLVLFYAVNRVVSQSYELYAMFLVPLMSTIVTAVVLYAFNAMLTPHILYFEGAFIMDLGYWGVLFLTLLLTLLVGSDYGGVVSKMGLLFAVMVAVVTGFPPQSQLLLASVLAASVVPSVGVFLSTLMFRKVYNDQERRLGRHAFILGMLFINEGAGYFALGNRRNVLPIFALASMGAGLLTFLFGIKTPFVYGGALPLAFDGVSRPLIYIGIILAMSIFVAIPMALLYRRHKS